jgi:hypothetical protein
VQQKADAANSAFWYNLFSNMHVGHTGGRPGRSRVSNARPGITPTTPTPTPDPTSNSASNEITPGEIALGGGLAGGSAGLLLGAALSKKKNKLRNALLGGALGAGAGALGGHYLGKQSAQQQRPSLREMLSAWEKTEGPKPRAVTTPLGPITQSPLSPELSAALQQHLGLKQHETPDELDAIDAILEREDSEKTSASTLENISGQIANLYNKIPHEVASGGAAGGLAGAAIGGLSGLVAPGTKKDKDGNRVGRSRLMTALQRAATGGALGAGAGAGLGYMRPDLVNRGIGQLPVTATMRNPERFTIDPVEPQMGADQLFAHDPSMA